MTEKERLETTLLKYNVYVNGLMFLTAEKGGIENDALAMRIKTAVKDLIRNELPKGEIANVPLTVE